METLGFPTPVILLLPAFQTNSPQRGWKPLGYLERHAVQTFQTNSPQRGWKLSYIQRFALGTVLSKPTPLSGDGNHCKHRVVHDYHLLSKPTPLNGDGNLRAAPQPLRPS